MITAAAGILNAQYSLVLVLQGVHLTQSPLMIPKVLVDRVVQVKECARLALEAVDGGMCVVIGLQR